MQKVQVLLQPTEIATQAEYGDSRLAGRTDGKRSSDSRISTWACCWTLARSSKAGSEPMLWVPNTTSTHGARRVIVGLVLLRQAAADGDLHAGPGVLYRQQMAKVPVEPVVGVLPDGAGIEDDHVRVGPVGGPLVARRLQEAGQALGVVHVHLAPVGADLEASLGRGAGHALKVRRLAPAQRPPQRPRPLAPARRELSRAGKDYTSVRIRRLSGSPGRARYAYDRQRERGRHRRQSTEQSGAADVQPNADVTVPAVPFGEWQSPITAAEVASAQVTGSFPDRPRRRCLVAAGPAGARAAGPR